MHWLFLAALLALAAVCGVIRAAPAPREDAENRPPAGEDARTRARRCLEASGDLERLAGAVEALRAVSERPVSGPRRRPRRRIGPVSQHQRGPLPARRPPGAGPGGAAGGRRAGGPVRVQSGVLHGERRRGSAHRRGLRAGSGAGRGPGQPQGPGRGAGRPVGGAGAPLSGPVRAAAGSGAAADARPGGGARRPVKDSKGRQGRIPLAAFAVSADRL